MCNTLHFLESNIDFPNSYVLVTHDLSNECVASCPICDAIEKLKNEDAGAKAQT